MMPLLTRDSSNFQEIIPTYIVKPKYLHRVAVL